MAISIHFTFFLSSFTTLIFLVLTHNPILASSKTLETDIEVLRSIKQSLDPNTISSSFFLKTWNFIVDPCDSPGPHFLGVICSIPENINSSSRITAISLEGDGIEGFLPLALGNLTELTSLNLRQNKFRGPIPDSITNLRKITALLLSENFISGNIPRGIRVFKRLQTIDLSHNRLSGSIPAVISTLRSLTHLSLSNNEFSGRVPDLTALWQLNTLDLSSNQLSGSLPELPNSLQSLSLAHNLLFGHISSLHKLRRLRQLDLSDNRFSGSINHGVFTLPEVIHVNLSQNRFTEIEVVRKSFNRASQIRVIEAQSNRISGHLPSNLVTYDNLMEVNLGHNLFSGEIPVEYGERVMSGDWRRVYLEYNFLEGKVPTGFNMIQSSGKGSLAHNCLIRCNRGIAVCHGGQRPPSECVRRD